VAKFEWPARVRSPQDWFKWFWASIRLNFQSRNLAKLIRLEYGANGAAVTVVPFAISSDEVLHYRRPRFSYNCRDQFVDPGFGGHPFGDYRSDVPKSKVVLSPIADGVADEDRSSIFLVHPFEARRQIYAIT
jgi:hypothetical protein